MGASATQALTALPALPSRSTGGDGDGEGNNWFPSPSSPPRCAQDGSAPTGGAERLRRRVPLVVDEAGREGRPGRERRGVGAGLPPRRVLVVGPEAAPWHGASGDGPGGRRRGARDVDGPRGHELVIRGVVDVQGRGDGTARAGARPVELLDVEEVEL